MAKNKTKLQEEALREFKHRVNYKINEVHYSPLVEMDEEFDELPPSGETGDENKVPKPTGGETTTPQENQPVGAETPVPAFDSGSSEMPPSPSSLPPQGGMPPMGEAPETERVDNIQNEIIKHNIEAMKNIHDQLKSLSDMTQSLDSKFNKLTTDVEEVREPSNVEKLMSKTNVSYPYYFNLNDFWSGNWFNEQRDKELSKGIKELPDGSYVADFDDLPQLSKTDIQSSFNEIS